jgi:putative hydrolase of the HAD superfamily
VIRAVIFDYGGVLMRTANPLPRRELEQRFGLPPGGAGGLVFRSALWDEAQLGHITGAAFWADVGQQLALDEEELAEFRQAFWAGDRLDRELMALVRHLRDESYRTALLSNAPAGLRSRLKRLAILDAFDVTVISGEEGVMKPDPEIFERTLARVGEPPEAAVFVDDSEANVTAARHMGMQATRFRGLAPLRRWLRDLGLPTPDADLTPVPDVRAVIFGWGGVFESRMEESDAVDHLNAEVRAAVRSLRTRYRVALLTHAAPGKQSRIREKWGLDVRAEFDAVVNSADVGLRKPDPAIFRLVLERLGVTPHQAILVHGGLRSVDLARELGVHAVQFVDSATALAELEALLGHPITE